MLGMRLPFVVVLASAMACAGGADGPSSSSAFDPTYGNDGTGPATGTGTGPDEGTTTMAPGDVTGDPPGGSCCAVAPTPGCGNPEIETCVCTIEPACCQGVWSQACVALAGDPCGDPECLAPGSTGEPGDGSSSDGPPTLSCDALAMQEGWMYWRCQDGDLQCNDMGTPTTDCDYCCGYCNAPGDVSCGDLATMNGWAQANCEWNGNGACGGQGTPTCDCNHCCQVG
jgi:hypothetical protein